MIMNKIIPLYIEHLCAHITYNINMCFIQIIQFIDMWNIVWVAIFYEMYTASQFLINIVISS